MSLRQPSLRPIAALVLAGALLAAGVAVPAEAAPRAKSYANCTALNKDYPHGVAKKGARDKVSGKAKPVTTFKVNSTVYAMNDGGPKRYRNEKDLDRDNDGVACEKR